MKEVTFQQKVISKGEVVWVSKSGLLDLDSVVYVMDEVGPHGHSICAVALSTGGILHVEGKSADLLALVEKKD